MIEIEQLAELYDSFRVSEIDQKWFQLNDLEKCLEQLDIAKEVIGYSFLKQPIYKISIGNGPKKVLIWSQMHGNESTGTRAMMDVLNFFKSNSNESQELLNHISFDFIPMLNPDGATLYSRRNAAGIDINRDFLVKESTEIHVLLQQIDKEPYEFLFNLHDQRTIFNVGETHEPATLSFLAPSYNENQDVNEVRERTMGVIQSINESLQKVIKGKIGRYSAEFYPTSTGDNFTQLGYSCLLFEAGHYPNDYQRNQTRKYNALAIILGLQTIANKSYNRFELYHQIPENKQRFLDVILRNVKLKHQENESIVDLGIYFVDSVNRSENELKTKGIIQEIGDLSNYFGHEEIDAQEAIYYGRNNDYPVLNSSPSFSVGEFEFENGLRIK